jgi:hypothetical protein
VAIFSNVARSIVIFTAFVLQEVSYISCSCLRVWNISCSGSVGAFVDGISVGGMVVLVSVKNFLAVISARWVGFWRLSMGQEGFE